MILTVGQSQQYPSIQHAINQIVTWLAGLSSVTLTESITIEVFEGAYGGFIIPPSSIRPTSAYKLIIKARSSNKVILSGFNTSTNLGHGSRMIGIGIGDNTPYIKIRGLRIENFHKGIVLSQGCNNCSIESNLVRNNSNVGLWVYRAEQAEILNNVILDHDNGIVLSEVNEVTVVGNDVVNYSDPPSSNQAGNRFCFHITTKLPNTSQPNGTIVLYNNNIASRSNNLIGYGPNVLSKLRSNYNNLYSIGGTYSVPLQGASSSPITYSLSEWQATSNNDHHSINTSIPYYINRQVGSSVFTEISLQNYILFGGIGAGLQNLCNTPAAGATGALVPHGVLPSYVDSSLLCETVQTNYSALSSPLGTTTYSRPTYVSIGAYDTNLDNAGFASQLVAPIGTTGSGLDNPQCQGNSYSYLDLLEEKYSQSVECIVPSVKAGFFYSNDAQYYLYSKKASYYIGSIMATDFQLSNRLYDTPSDGTDGIKLIFDGKELNYKYYKVYGNILRFYHNDLNIEDPNKKLTIIGTIQSWSGNRFIAKTYRQDIRIRDGYTRYFLPENPTRGAPIVLTDDTIGLSNDPSELKMEFTTKWSSQENKVEVIFNKPYNLLQNPQFIYSNPDETGYTTEGDVSTIPANWTIKGDSSAILMDKVVTTSDETLHVYPYGTLGPTETLYGNTGGQFSYTGYQFKNISSGLYNLYPVIGKNMVVIYHDLSTGYGISQVVRNIDYNKPYWFTYYAASIRNIGESINTVAYDTNITWSFYDQEHRPLNLSTGDIYSGCVSIPTTSNYTQYNSIWNRYGIVFSNSAISILNAYEQTDVISPTSLLYNPIGIPSGATHIELTIGSTGYTAICGTTFVQSNYPGPYNRVIKGKEATIEYDTGTSDLYDVSDLSITSVRNNNINGFLYIGGLPAGEFDNDAPPNTTTLTDWNWATGRLKYLPWARTSGKNKLSHRANFTIDSSGKTEDVSISPKVPYPDEIEVIPRIPISNLSDGVGPLEQFVNRTDTTPGVKGTDFIVRVTDTYGNPYAFENVTVQIASNAGNPATNNFIGYIGTKELGFYTQYSSKIKTRLDSAGTALFRWIPPASDNTQVVISNPLLDIKSDHIGGQVFRYIDNLPYRVNTLNMGNPFLSTPSNPNGYLLYNPFYDKEEFLQPFTVINQNGYSLYAYRLNNYPYANGMKVWVNTGGTFPPTGTGGLDLLRSVYQSNLVLSDEPEINNGQFFIDETNRTLFVNYSGPTADPSRSIRTTYKNRLLYLLSDDKGVVYQNRYYIDPDFYTTILSDINPGNPLSISYDITIDLVVRAHSPTGMSFETISVQSSYSTGLATLNIRDKNLVSSLVGKSIPKRIGL